MTSLISLFDKGYGIPRVKKRHKNPNPRRLLWRNTIFIQTLCKGANQPGDSFPYLHGFRYPYSFVRDEVEISSPLCARQAAGYSKQLKNHFRTGLLVEFEKGLCLKGVRITPGKTEGWIINLFAH